MPYCRPQVKLFHSRSGKLPIKLIIILLVLVGGGAFAAMRLMGNGQAEAQDGSAEAASEKGEETEKAETESPAQTVSLGEFLVNIRSNDGQLRYLKAEVCLVAHAMVAEKPKKRHGGSEQPEAELPCASHRYARDVTIAVLSNQQFDNLRSAEGRQKLKAVLQQKLDSALRDYRVSDVLFTAFVMQ
jgi:flagellar basal body-associated protein FliL